MPCNLEEGRQAGARGGHEAAQEAGAAALDPSFRAPGGKIAYREWLPFLSLVDASYWNTELTDED